MQPFIHEHFLLQTKTAQELYHTFAKDLPIYDYHCHLSPQQVAENKPFENITQMWLYGDHYKWRGMRSNGEPEKYCTGVATDKEKFMAWARTVPSTLRNPLYHWTHLELKRYFNIDTLLNEETAADIYARCNALIAKEQMSPYTIFSKMQVKVVCTTDDPIDALAYHATVNADTACPTKMYPTFRPDRSMAVEDPTAWNAYIDTLAEVWGAPITSFDTLCTALKSRHDHFHAAGCRLSDHGIGTPVATPYTPDDCEQAFSHIRTNKTLSATQAAHLKTALMMSFGTWNAARGWTMQLHMGALRNNNTRMFKAIGADTGFDSIADTEIAAPLSRLLDMLDSAENLPKTILYNLNPKDNEVLATMLGNFQDGSIPGKIQLGSGWWFLDQKEGMVRQLNALSSLGLLSRFVGMLTDSRSLLSYPRHEYFRRILCNLLGDDMEHGALPNDLALIGKMVQDICYYNAVNYFDLKLSE